MKTRGSRWHAESVASLFLIAVVAVMTCSCELNAIEDFENYSAPLVWSVPCDLAGERMLVDGDFVFFDYAKGGIVSVKAATGAINYRHEYVFALPGGSTRIGSDLYCIQSGSATVGPPFGIGRYATDGTFLGHIILPGDEWERLFQSKLRHFGTRLFWIRFEGIAALDLSRDVSTDPEDGSLHGAPTMVWERPVDGPFVPTAMTIDSEGMLYVVLWGFKGSGHSKLVKIDSFTGEWLWETALVDDPLEPDPAPMCHGIAVIDDATHPYDGHVALVLTNEAWKNTGLLYVDREAGTIVRQYRDLGGAAVPVLYDGMYYCVTGGREVRCIDAGSGKLVWKYCWSRLDSDLGSVAPVVHKGVVYLLSPVGLLSFDARTGTPLFADTSVYWDNWTFSYIRIVYGDLLILSNTLQGKVLAVRMDVHARR